MSPLGLWGKRFFLVLSSVFFPPQGLWAQNYGAEPFYVPVSGTIPSFPFSYPNPFGISQDCQGNIGGVCFAFEPEVDGVATLQIFDLSGYRLRSITYTNPTTNDGVPDRIHWDGTNQKGYQVVNGVYIYRIEVESATGAGQSFVGLCYKFSSP